MQFSTFLMASLVVSLLMLFTTPATEATFLLIACMLRSPMCPWITAATTTTKKSAGSPATGSKSDSGTGK